MVAARSTALKAFLTSAVVFAVSNEKRIICLEATDSGFIALTTCDGSSELARHADPEDAQMPS
jgi:hypothetical protein